jgi:hypothetical protein
MQLGAQPNAHPPITLTAGAEQRQCEQPYDVANRFSRGPPNFASVRGEERAKRGTECVREKRESHKVGPEKGWKSDRPGETMTRR